MWLGVDDTDSRRGGCTTHLAGLIISELQLAGFDLIGFPRLVRLNPNVPWKTRGNGAVSFQIGKGSGSSQKVGHVHDVDVLSYSSTRGVDLDVSAVDVVRSVVLDQVRSVARLDDDNTNPGVVMVSEQFEESLYWKGVREVLDKEELIGFIDGQDGWFQEFNNGRGIIGAAAGIAWRGDHDSTFELISYRHKDRWGLLRSVNKSSVVQMDKTCVSTFDNFDYGNDHVNIMPNSPCPVLFGIRGDVAERLPVCMSMIETEDFDDWLIFASNQGTDDHLVSRSLSSIQAFQSVIVKGKVSMKPVTIRGGHVIFSICDEYGSGVDCAAYEPTKEFRDVIRFLDVGDVVTVFGGVRSEPFTVNVEKIRVDQLVDVFVKVENPVCPVCGKHMKSKGKNQGFYCKKCKTRAENAIMEKKKRGIVEGLYEVPVCARRHLSKPLKRIDI